VSSTDQELIAGFAVRVAAAHGLAVTEADVRLALSLPEHHRGPAASFLAGVVAAAAYVREGGI
jgi:hypothetical protein